MNFYKVTHNLKKYYMFITNVLNFRYKQLYISKKKKLWYNRYEKI